MYIVPVFPDDSDKNYLLAIAAPSLTTTFRKINQNNAIDHPVTVFGWEGGWGSKHFPIS